MKVEHKIKNIDLICPNCEYKLTIQVTADKQSANFKKVPVEEVQKLRKKIQEYKINMAN